MKDRQYDAVARIDEADFDNDSTFNSRIIIKINQVCQQTYAFVEINGRNCIGNAVGQGGMERPVKDDKAVERSSATAGFPDKVRGQAVRAQERCRHARLPAVRATLVAKLVLRTALPKRKAVFRYARQKGIGRISFRRHLASSFQNQAQMALTRLLAKEEIVINYFKNVWNVQFYDDAMGNKGLVSLVQDAINQIVNENTPE